MDAAAPPNAVFQDWELAGAAPALRQDALVVDVEGFEGPLDLLLHLARRQRVDLSRISVLALADQFLDFITRARGLRLELAADYLVMAAWLAYLKSRLLVPARAGGEAETGEEMAALLQFRLRRLEAMREAGARLMARDRLGHDVFPRGMPEPVRVEKRAAHSASLYDLLTAYSVRRQRRATTHLRIPKREVWSLQEARQALTRLLGAEGDWAALDSFLRVWCARPGERASALASSFAAGLELVREGRLEMRQDGAFAPLYLRARETADRAVAGS